VQINVLVNTNFASGLTDAAGHVIKRTRILAGLRLPSDATSLGIFGVAIASATLPSISRASRQTIWRNFATPIGMALSLVMLLTIPSARAWPSWEEA